MIATPCPHCGTKLTFRVLKGVRQWHCTQQCRKQVTKSRISIRFWAHVDKTEGDETCWPWQGYCDSFGYGKFQVTDGKTALAHRVSYELIVGVIPSGLCVLHSCDNPPCVNPYHLFLGTRIDNNQDKIKKSRHVYGSRVIFAKLVEEQVLTIKQRLSQDSTPESKLKIAMDFNVRTSTIHRIHIGATWKQVICPIE
jgi:hypothetical protein